MVATPTASALRQGEGADRVTNIELFFDLVYVFAVTQLSHLLVEHVGVEGAGQAAILLAMVWQVWIYTTWTTNYLDPSRTSVRVVLLALMLGSLVLAAELPEAFHRRGLVVAVAYAAMQIGRAVFTLVALRGEDLQATFRRVLVWSTASGIVMIIGGLEHDHARELLWVSPSRWTYWGPRSGSTSPGSGTRSRPTGRCSAGTSPNAARHSS